MVAHVIMTAANLATIAVNADSAFHAIRYSIKQVYAIISEYNGTEEVKHAASRLLHKTLLHQLPYKDYLAQTLTLFRSVLPRDAISPLEAAFAHFESYNLEKYIDIFWKGIYLHKLAELTVKVPESTPAAALDFEYCSTANFHLMPPQFSMDPWFKVKSIILTVKKRFLPPGVFSFMPYLKFADLSETELEILPDRAFTGCSNLEEVLLPDTMYSLGPDAFSMTSIEKLSLPSSLVFIGARCFASSLITEIEQKSIPKIIKTRAFEGCYNLRAPLAIGPETVLSTQTYAGCTSLTELDLENYRVVPSSFFVGCVNITKVIIPPTLKLLSRAAFKGCTSLATVIVKPRECPLQIEKSVFAYTSLSAVDLSMATFTKLEQRWVPALPSSLSAALLPRNLSSDFLVRVFKGKRDRVSFATKAGRHRFNKRVFKIFQRPSFLPFHCTEKLPSHFKETFSLLLYKKKKVVKLPTEVWHTIIFLSSW